MFNFFRKKRSAESAKERLQLVLVHDRTDLTSAQLEALKNELLTAIRVTLTLTPKRCESDWNAMAGLNGWWQIFPCGAYRAIAQADLLYLGHGST